LIRKAVDAYNNAVSAQEEGDWAAYGAYLNELESYLNQLNDGGEQQKQDVQNTDDQVSNDGESAAETENGAE